MLSEIIKTIEKYSMLDLKDKVIIGLSGGADSVCLLHNLLALRDRYGIAVIAVHVNHCLRKAAEADEKFVRTVCRDLNLPLEVYRVSVRDLAKEKGLSLEAAGRLARYDSFEKAVKQHGADKIAVAHHEGDNAETVLMNLIRGAGPRGLSGIPPTRGIIIRPLIHISREKIELYCHDNGLLYCTDETNLSDSYLRNKIRLRLIPELKEINPLVEESLLKTGLILREEDQYMDTLALEFYEKAKVNSDPSLLSIKELETQPDVMRRRIFRQACSRHNPALTNLSYEHCVKIMGIMRGATGKTLSLPGGIFVQKQYGCLAFLSSERLEDSDYAYDIPLDTFVFIPETGCYVTLSLKNIDKSEKWVNVYTKKISYDKIKSTIQVRNRRSGDKIYIRSIGGRKKLKDYFIDNKISRIERERIPLVAVGSEIIWILDEKLIFSDLFLPTKDGCCATIQIWRAIK